MKFDRFQQQAMDYISEGYSVIVAAPTGAGKTVIAEHVIQQCLDNNRKVIYTAPIKALSNQKYRDFFDETKNHVGILTGDITLNPKAPVLIMTTEIFRNKIIENDESLNDFSWIIFDEIHYLDDYERGTVWEESLIFLPDHMKVLGLSATIPNIDELKRWMESIHNREIRIVRETNRPVPLHFFYQCQGRFYDDIKRVTKKGFRGKSNKQIKNRRLPRFVKVYQNKPDQLIEELRDNDHLPCIYFAFSRKKTESLAKDMQVFDFLNDTERKEILDLFNELLERFDLEQEASALEMLPLVSRGIAYHHAGMLPSLKEVIERLFTSRLLKLIFTTETFALGINMPAKAVCFDELRKFYGRGFSVLTTRDLYQMAGRAGRRSIDTEGFVYLRVNPHDLSPEQLYKLVYGKPEPVRSQFNASYATVLNLYQHYGEKLYEIYPKSFHYFQSKKHHQKQAVYYLKAKVDILKELGYIENEQLTTKGFFACHVYGYELILSELFEDGVIDKLSLKQLGVLALAVVYEPRKGMTKPKLSQETRELEKRTRKIVRQVHRLEKIVGLRDRTKSCYFHLSNAFEVWIQGKRFDETIELTDCDEGEVVRYFRMTIQLLREMSEGPVTRGVSDKVHKLIDMINRDVVDSERQLNVKLD